MLYARLAEAQHLLFDTEHLSVLLNFRVFTLKWLQTTMIQINSTNHFEHTIGNLQLTITNSIHYTNNHRNRNQLYLSYGCNYNGFRSKLLINISQ